MGRHCSPVGNSGRTGSHSDLGSAAAALVEYGLDSAALSGPVDFRSSGGARIGS
jgi:hypothetical protein